MVILAIETSCDETSVAVVRDGEVLSNAVSSQIRLHQEYGGVVPELATREHLKNFMPTARAAMGDAGVGMADIDAVAATRGPGLPPALMIGLKAAQAVAFALEKPFIGIHHHEAHLYSPWIGGTPLRAKFENFEPNVSLIVSGGHTMLVHVESERTHRVLGGTIDDAAGECFDKTAKLIGLRYPGGPEMDRLAREGDPTAYTFPRPLLNQDNDDFSFSGLKTSVRYFLEKNEDVLRERSSVCDLCASVQAAIVEVLVKKTVRVARRMKLSCVTASGGVTCNSALRLELEKACAKNRLTLRLCDPLLSTDNAAMIGVLAERKLLAGEDSTELDVEIKAGWALV